MLPINRYIFETFNKTNNDIGEVNRYHININLIKEDQVLIELSAQYDDIKIEFENVSNVTLKNASGFKKYMISNEVNFNIYFNVINKKNRPANYLIRYYYTEVAKEYEYYFDENFELKEISSNDKNISISLTFNSIKIKTWEKRDKEVIKNGIYFLIIGTLYKNDETLKENINSMSQLTKHIPFFTNITKHYESYSHPENWTLIYENIPRNNNFIYDLQLKINDIISKDLLNEEILMYKTTVDLTNIEIKTNRIFIIILIIISGFIIILAIFFIIKFIRLQKRNSSLEEEIKSLSYTNNIQKNILNKEKIKYEKETDYDSTFI